MVELHVACHLCVSFSAQASGQPSVLYYAPLLFEKLGVVGNVSATGVTAGLGLTKVRDIRTNFVDWLICNFTSLLLVSVVSKV